MVYDPCSRTSKHLFLLSMTGSIRMRIPKIYTCNGTRRTQLPFSTASGFGGRGGGRGGPLPGSMPLNFNERTPGKSNSSESNSESPVPPPGHGHGHGHGHGRGKPIPPSGPPSVSSFISYINQAPSGRGRADSESKKPIFFKREDSVSPSDEHHDNKLPGSILSGVLSGLGRGKHTKHADHEMRVPEENRHLRTRQTQTPGADASERRRMPSQDDESGSGRGRGFRENGVLGRGRGIGRGRGRGRGRGIGRGRGEGFRERDVAERRFKDAEDSYATGLYTGDDADGERLAKKFGPQIMDQLTQGFEEMTSRVLPSPLEDEYLNALDINCAIEFEPEYLVEFDNPDIDEKEPIPLRDALEKMKPFLMAYEGIESQEEWEEIMEETMARVPLLKKIVDHYGGPDRVTAKKQQEELERVAKTLPESAPFSVKQFTNRAVISLQSNPGWGFDKKCHFMDKLVWEVSQHYK